MQKKKWKAVIALLAACSLLAGCGADTDGETKSSTAEAGAQTQETETEAGFDEIEGEVLGRTYVENDWFEADSGVGFVSVYFPDYSFTADLPRVLWDPDDFVNVVDDDENGEDAMDLPLTDWTTDDMLAVVVPSTAYFSVIDQDADLTIEELSAMSDDEYVEKKLENSDNVIVEDVQRSEIEDGVQMTMKMQIDLVLYDWTFTFEGYWITVYHGDQMLDFSYGERVYDDLDSYETETVVLDGFRYGD